MNLFMEKCPRCKTALEVKDHPSSKSIIVKACPAGNYKKVFHPAYDIYIERNKVS